MFAPAMRDLHSGIAAQGQTEAPAQNAKLDFHFVSARCLHVYTAPLETALQHWTARRAASSLVVLAQVSLVCVDGRLYELDGNNDGPIDCGPVHTPQDFLQVSGRVHWHTTLHSPASALAATEPRFDA